MPITLLKDEKGSLSSNSLPQVERCSFPPLNLTFTTTSAFYARWLLGPDKTQLEYQFDIIAGEFIPRAGKYIYLTDEIFEKNIPYTVTATVRACERLGVVVNMEKDGAGYGVYFIIENGKTK